MREVTPEEAYKLMASDPEIIYLDVRSVPEYEAGHAAGAINIPLLHFTPGVGMTPNPDFINVVDANLPKDAKLVVGCKTGGRSARACEMLSQIGYNDPANIRGGFVGVVDPSGRVVEAGWSSLNLPVCTECKPEAGYEALAAKAKA
ncbi:MAG TPA: rhodanese-like domain-containing protein [Blastocatellia bacterium]|nr:rhodanese-like domain-containing protein [Blastocatellia bacterium]